MGQFRRLAGDPAPRGCADDLPDDPQGIANGYVAQFEHPVHGPTRVVSMPVRLGETPGPVRLPAPEFGQHTEEVLLDVLTWGVM